MLAHILNVDICFTWTVAPPHFYHGKEAVRIINQQYGSKRRHEPPVPRAETLESEQIVAQHSSIALLLRLYRFPTFPWPHRISLSSVTLLVAHSSDSMAPIQIGCFA